MKHAIRSGIILVLLLPLLAGCPLGRGSKKLGEECASNNDCAGARCEASVCTTACKANADCTTPAIKMACKGNEKSATNPEGWGVCAVSP